MAVAGSSVGFRHRADGSVF